MQIRPHQLDSRILGEGEDSTVPLGYPVQEGSPIQFLVWIFCFTPGKASNLSSRVESWPIDFCKNKLDFKRLSPWKFVSAPVCPERVFIEILFADWIIPLDVSSGRRSELQKKTKEKWTALSADEQKQWNHRPSALSISLSSDG